MHGAECGYLPLVAGMMWGMCRHKPGPRCHKHSLRSFQSAKAARARTRARVKELMDSADTVPEQVLERAVSNAEKAQARFVLAQRRLDATGTGMEQLEARLGDESLSKAARARLVARREEALWLREARKQQVKAMPERGDHDRATATAFDALGQIREDIAHVDAQIAAGSGYPSQQLLTERDRLQSEVLGRDATYRVLAAGRAADMDRLSAREAGVMVHCDQSLRDRIVFQSHVRAAVAQQGAHPIQTEALVEQRDRELAAAIDAAFPETAPPAAGVTGASDDERDGAGSDADEGAPAGGDRDPSGGPAGEGKGSSAAEAGPDGGRDGGDGAVAPAARVPARPARQGRREPAAWEQMLANMSRSRYGSRSRRSSRSGRSASRSGGDSVEDQLRDAGTQALEAPADWLSKLVDGIADEVTPR